MATIDAAAATSVRDRATRTARLLVRFAWIEAQCCLFAVLIFAGLG